MAGQRGWTALHERDVLAREQQAGRAVLPFDCMAPGHGGLHRVAGPPQIHAGNQAQAGCVLNRLVRRPVFAKPDRIVREDEYRTQLHQRGHAQRIARVVGEREERADVGNESPVQGEAVGDGAHREFTDAVVHVVAQASGVRGGGDGHRSRPVGEDRAREIGRAADELRKVRRQRLDGLLRRFARGDGFPFRGLRGDEGVRDGGKVRGQLPGHPPREFGGQGRMRGAVRRESCVPVLFEQRAALARAPRRIDVGRNFERRMGPAQRGARCRDFLFSERRAVRRFRSGLGRRALADDRLAADQCRLVGDRLRGLDGGVDGGHIVTVDLGDHVPAIGFEPPRRVVGEPAFDVAVDRNAVVVVERDQLAQAPRAGERTGFMRNAFHQAAIAQKDIGVVIDDRVAGPVELRGEQFFGERHADRVGQSLSERAGGGFHAGRDADLRMAGRLRMELAKIAQFGDRKIVAREMQQRVLQHRTVPVGQHEAIAIGPARIRRIVAQMAVPQRDGDFRHAHRHAGMAGFCGFHRVHRQCADCIGKLLVGDACSGGGDRHFSSFEIGGNTGRRALMK